MANVEMWFPVTIYRQPDLLTSIENAQLALQCVSLKNNTPPGGSDWVGGTYNTHGTHDISKDSNFTNLLELITHHVNEFAKMHNSTETYKLDYAWLNIATAGNYQEFHTHNGNVFSAVYYISAPLGSGKIVFEDPKEPDMMPLRKVSDKNTLSYSRISYEATEGTLLIFRSYLRHLVEGGTNTDPRISLALNFK
jgi:uncharacterized protein (TIGR02466 family)